MTYPKSFTTAQQLLISPLVEKIEALAPEESFSIRSTSPGASSSIRSLLYAYLAISERKEEFTIKRLTSSELLVLRRPDMSFETSSVGRKEHPRLSEFIHIKDADQLLIELNEAGLKPKDIVEIHKQWTKIHS